MQTHRTLARAGRDGMLHLEIPAGIPGAEFEVVVVIQPSSRPSALSAPEDLGWPPHFFEDTAGSIDDPTFLRREQGEFENRPEI